jgi:hypothetical protein
MMIHYSSLRSIRIGKPKHSILLSYRFWSIWRFFCLPTLLDPSWTMRRGKRATGTQTIGSHNSYSLYRFDYMIRNGMTFDPAMGNEPTGG